MGILESFQSSILGIGSREDIFLAPHSDDICFSIGNIARKRNAGTLLTVFPVSFYRVDQSLGSPVDIRATTRKRSSEDLAFAELCGLNAIHLDFYDAPARGQQPFDAGHAYTVADLIQDQLIRALIGPRIGLVPEPKPWLFCPSAIGAHVDHAAVLVTIVRNLHFLRTHYHIAFYEDLHYASDPVRRQTGLNILNQLLEGYELKHCWFELGKEAQKSKMQMIHLYDSQLTPAISSIESYTPAASECILPHEALWQIQDDKLHESG